MKERRPVLAIRLLLLVTAVLIMTTGIANATPTATRTLPAELVPADRSFPVEIEVSGYGTVVETLPDGFTYMSSSLDPNAVRFYGQTNTIEFKVTKDKYLYFTYSVALRYYDLDEGTYTFSGVLRDRNGEYEIGGDTEIVLAEPEDDDDAEPTAMRTLPEEPVSADERFTIEIEASHYGIHGFVIETLPDGFEFEDYSGLVEVEGDTVEFELWGEPSFTYTVTAPDTEGTYTFSGILIDEEKNEYDIGGDTEIVVGGEEGGEVTLSTNITAWKPIEAVVNRAVGESRTFNISINQPADISWQINGTEVQINESVTDAVYTNTSAVIGTWNVSAVATNATTGLSDMHTWIWRATATPAANMTSTPTPTSAVAPTPLVTPTPKSKLSPRPTSSATPTPTKSAKPAIPGFESVFALAAIFAVAYMLLFRKKGDEGR
ncbi:MAG: PGF-CTERM sorting domain-containing protein [Euryarchaeota archaeon]|nr:PGF-CTERM sorting domain-containing protein [Euryarchaeota archaeon]